MSTTTFENRAGHSLLNSFTRQDTMFNENRGEKRGTDVDFITSHHGRWRMRINKQKKGANK